MALGKETIGEAFIRILADGSALGRSIKEQARRKSKDVEKAGGDSEEDFEKGWIRRAKKSDKPSESFLRKLEQDLAKSGRFFKNFGDASDELAPKLSKLFGKGSRNNALNFFGSVIEGMVGLVGLFPKALSGVDDLAKGFVKSFADAREGGAGFFKSLAEGVGGLGETFASFSKSGPAGLGVLAAALAAVIVLIPVVMTLLGAMASALSLVAAAAVALASALTFAVVGAIAPLVGLILPLVAAFGVLGLAFTGLGEKAGKALKKSLLPLKKSIDDLRKTAQAPILNALTDNSGKFAKTVSTLKPLIDGVAHAIAGIVDSFATVTQSAGFKDFISVMTENLPKQVQGLGAILTAALAGVGGIFVALQPSVNAFLTDVRRITTQFAAWANSKSGQATLKKFFDDARVSAGKAWNIIKQVAIDLGLLIASGKDTGDSFLDSLLSSLKDLGVWLRSHPGELQRWFRDAKKIGKDIGDVANAVINLFDKMDTPDNRRIAHDIFTVIKGAVVVMGAAFTAVAVPVRALSGVVLHTMRDMGGAVESFLRTARQMITPFERLPGAAGAAARGMGRALDGAITKVHNVNSALDTALRDRDLDIDTTVTDYQKTISQLATIRLKVLKIPKEVTIGVNAKLKAQLPIPGTATGGLFNGPQHRLIGEAGPEAVVPLNRPLALVDPAVRELSAIAQGKATPAANGTVAGGRSLSIAALTVVTPTKDPKAVAHEVVDRLIGASGF